YLYLEIYYFPTRRSSDLPELRKGPGGNAGAFSRSGINWQASTGRARASVGLDASTNQAIIPYLIPRHSPNTDHECLTAGQVNKAEAQAPPSSPRHSRNYSAPRSLGSLTWMTTRSPWSSASACSRGSTNRALRKPTHRH